MKKLTKTNDGRAMRLFSEMGGIDAVYVEEAFLYDAQADNAVYLGETGHVKDRLKKYGAIAGVFTGVSVVIAAAVWGVRHRDVLRKFLPKVA